MTITFAPNRFALFALSVLAVLAITPAGAQAKDAATTAAASSQRAATHVAFATPKIKHHRRTANRHAARQIAAMQPPGGPQCFLFWCGNRPIAAPWLVLGVAY